MKAAAATTETGRKSHKEKSFSYTHCLTLGLAALHRSLVQSLNQKLKFIHFGSFNKFSSSSWTFNTKELHRQHHPFGKTFAYIDGNLFFFFSPSTSPLFYGKLLFLANQFNQTQDYNKENETFKDHKFILYYCFAFVVVSSFLWFIFSVGWSHGCVYLCVCAERCALSSSWFIFSSSRHRCRLHCSFVIISSPQSNKEAILVDQVIPPAIHWRVVSLY